METPKTALGFRVAMALVLASCLALACGDKGDGSPGADEPSGTAGTDDPIGAAGTDGASEDAGTDAAAGAGGSDEEAGAGGSDEEAGAGGADWLWEDDEMDAAAGAGGTDAPWRDAGTDAAAGAGGTDAAAGAGGTDEPSGAGGTDGPSGAGGTEPTSDPDEDPGGTGSPACDDSQENPDQCQVCTRQGLVRGGRDGTTCEYLGIPYAKPPVDDLRWAPPEPAERWTGVLAATSFGPACVQSMDLSGSIEKSEDCLFINVWAPAAAPGEALPVMVFVHGGGYTGGATNTYSGLNLAENGPVVVVNMNYRLGSLGYFAHPDLDSQRPDAPSGSDGIRDQQLALRWVRDNIESFQGDPDNVTLFGESAGSSSVCIHMVSPGSRGLAKRFIMESGVCISGVENGIEPISQEAMYSLSEQMAADLCPGASDVIGCLRGIPADDVVLWTSAGASGGSGGELRWVPVIEGPGGVLPAHPDELIESGELSQGEVIIGTNQNEYLLFQLMEGVVETVDQLRSEVEAQYGDRADEIMAIYAPGADADANQAYITMMTDVMFRCASRRLARQAEALGNSVYLYSFEQGTAMHADEMTYVFGYGYYSLGVFLPVQSLVTAVQGYWTNFAASGDPNTQSLVTWPEYDTDSDQHIILVNPVSTGSGLQREACDFWDSYLANP